ncbi:26972_t:CDS:2 [Racocetra persica]|uniref:26972_t:CDS:1 n=1 Tax=Racocetra persica TaxID=160502 RepID=A0ACA9KDZ5_9GLOM|nr:26972_t:CDS:2 [Racocetra persica]
MSSCDHCKKRFIGYPETFCRRKFRPQQECENPAIREFLQDIQENSAFCNNFIDWVPDSDVNYEKSHRRNEFSEIFLGKWMPLSSLNIVLKVLRDSRNIDHKFLNEFRIHHQCLGKCAIPFYGLTLYKKTLDYAMIMKRAVHGDLCNYIHTHKFKLSWTERIKILVNITEDLEHLHNLNLVHHDFHCKNILVDEEDKIFICDFGLSCAINSQTVHDVNLALKIVMGGRPEITNDTPEPYKVVMEKCWDNDPLKRPETSELLQIFSDMPNDLRQNIETIQSFRSNDEQDTPVADNPTSINMDYQTRQFDIDIRLDSDSDMYEQESVRNNEYNVWQSLESLSDDFFNLPTRSFLVESLIHLSLSSSSDDMPTICDQVPSLLDLSNLFAVISDISNPDVQNELSEK